MTVPFEKYLEAKARLDTRSLHPATWTLFLERLRRDPPKRLLDLGAGTCVMLERLFREGALHDSGYWALERESSLLALAQARLGNLVRLYPDTASGLVLYPLQATWEDFSAKLPDRPWDAVTAHAFLDLVDAPSSLGVLASMTRGGAPLYASLNFDGLTQWYPSLPEDDILMELYHADMAGDLPGGGQRSGPRAGRQIMNAAEEKGWKVLSAGPSDWVVLPGTDDDGTRSFLLWMLQTIEKVLGEKARLWLEQRRQQVVEGRLGLRVSNWDILLERQ